MKTTAPYVAWILLAALGCAETPSAELLVPHTTAVRWADGYDEPDDGIGALVPIDIMAYDSVSGEPLTDVEITVWAEGDTIWPVPAEALVVVDPDECVTCELWWDAERDEFIEALPYRASLAQRSDADGLVRLFIFVDAFPEPLDAFPSDPSLSEGGMIEGLAVFVTMGTLEESFVLTPR